MNPAIFAASGRLSCDVTAVLHERKQSLECLWRERYRITFPQQQALIRIDAKQAEFVYLLGWHGVELA